MKSNIPISCASIHNKNRNNFTISNSKGEFLIRVQKLPASVSIRKFGYKEETVKISSHEVTISLHPVPVNTRGRYNGKIINQNAVLLKRAVEKFRNSSAFTTANNSSKELVYCRITSSIDSTINSFFESYAQMNVTSNTLGDYQSRVTRYASSGVIIPELEENRLSFDIDAYIRIPYIYLKKYIKNEGSIEFSGKRIAIIRLSYGYKRILHYYINTEDTTIVYIKSTKGPEKNYKRTGSEKANLDDIITTTEISFFPPVERNKSGRLSCVAETERSILIGKNSIDHLISKSSIFTVLPDSSLLNEKVNEYLSDEASIKHTNQFNYNAKFLLSAKIGLFESETQKLLLKPYIPSFWAENSLIKPNLSEEKQIQIWENNNTFYSEKSMMDSDQTDAIDTLVKKINSNIVYVENVYIETDNSYYLTGDTIWFSAFVLDNLLMDSTSLSKILYVDLINPQNNLEKRLKLLIKEGRASGDFILNEDVKSGIFRIRAYTQWMRNFQSDYFFEKDIPVYKSNIDNLVSVNPMINRSADGDSVNLYLQALLPAKYKNLDKKLDLFIRLNDSISVQKSFDFIGDFNGSMGFFVPDSFPSPFADIKLTLSDTALISEQRLTLPLKPGIDIQFFPESGKMVAGMETFVAFKAVDTKGNPAEFVADIMDENKNIIIRIEGNKSGIGKFRFTPRVNQVLSAVVNLKGNKYVFKLPVIEPSGFILSFDPDSSMILVKSSLNSGKSRNYLVLSMRGGIINTVGLNSGSRAVKVRLPFNSYPRGILQITLMDSLYRPLAERLVFNNPPGKKMLINVKKERQDYRQREKVNLTIKVTDAKRNPVKSTLSISIVDASKTDSAISTADIVSYLFLTSELKGKIDESMIDLSDTTHEGKKKIDLVMMTQGWRNYLWNSIRYRSSLDIVYPAEKGFYIDGSILSSNVHKPFNEYKINFFDAKTGFNDIIDVNEKGRFSAGFPLFDDIHSFIIQCKNNKNIIEDLRFTLDTISSPGIEKRNNELPYAMYKPGYFKTMKEIFAETDTLDTPYLGKYMIPEVVVKARYRPQYSKPDKIVNLDKTDPTGKKYGSLTQMIASEFGEKAFIDMKGKPCSPIIVVNGNVYDRQFSFSRSDASKFANYSSILAIPVNEISNVKFYEAGSDYSQFLTPAFPMAFYLALMRGGQNPAPILMKMSWGSLPVVSFTTYYNYYRGDPKGTVRITFQGLYQVREFYQPRYDLNSPVKNDNRSTIYWNPEVKTDSTGIAKISFYNSDLKGKALIKISGVSYQLKDASSIVSNFISK